MFGNTWITIREYFRGVLSEPFETEEIEIEEIKQDPKINIIKTDLRPAFMFNYEILRERLKKHEGFRATFYEDTRGNQTIGYGCKEISEMDAAVLLKSQVITANFEVFKNVSNFDKLPINCQMVLVEMCFNLGLPKFMTFKKMLAAIKIQDFNKAADEMCDSKWAVQVGKEKGQRAYVLAEIMRDC